MRELEAIEIRYVSGGEQDGQAEHDLSRDMITITAPRVDPNELSGLELTTLKVTSLLNGIAIVATAAALGTAAGVGPGSAAGLAAGAYVGVKGAEAAAEPEQFAFETNAELDRQDAMAEVGDVIVDAVSETLDRFHRALP